MAFLDISHLQKRFAGQTAVHDFSIGIERGEFITFLGPSGCGKTTILRMLAGFESPSSGSIVFDGKDVTHVPTNQRNVGMVFQSYALFPNMTVAENIGFGLKVANMAQSAIDARVKEMLALIKLDTLAGRYPWQMSGGQQQRVALARAIANKPKVLLLDEPLSALDAKIRIALREEIRALQRALDITTVFVTHDQEEALSISDRIVVLNEGRVEQIGAPSDIYNYPRTRFVASFIGTLNQLQAKVVDAGTGGISIAGHLVITSSALGNLRKAEPCMVAIRPEAISFDTHEAGVHPARSAQAGQNSIEARVEEVSFLGSIVRIRTSIAGVQGEPAAVISLDVFNDPNQPPPQRGAAVTLCFSFENLLVLG
jgi:putative spermidine/putrescine transport system ATP-binding protein